MINCPKCNELLGEQSDRCPFCRTTITEEVRKKALQDQERVRASAVTEAMKEYSKRIRYEIITCVLMIIIAMAGTFAIVAFELHEALIPVIFGGVFALYILSIVKFRVGLCPYCEQFTGRGSWLRSYCSRCGGRLR